MATYSDSDLDDAIERIAGDVARRAALPDFAGPAMTALVDQLRRIEAARRSGDAATAGLLATAAQPALESYRPTNATSRSKAILAELVVELIAHHLPPDAQSAGAETETRSHVDD
jgi:hypothetical protein